MGLFSQEIKSGVKVRINRTTTTPEGIWHKRSEYDQKERLISSIVEVENLKYKGFDVKTEKVIDMTAEVRLSDELFEEVLEHFASDEYTGARGLIFTFILSADPILQELTVRGENKKSWKMYVAEIIDVEAAISDGGGVAVASQNELDDILSGASQKARADRSAASAELRAKRSQQLSLMNTTAAEGTTQEPATATKAGTGFAKK